MIFVKCLASRFVFAFSLLDFDLPALFNYLDGGSVSCFKGFLSRLNLLQLVVYLSASVVHLVKSSLNLIDFVIQLSSEHIRLSQKYNKACSYRVYDFVQYYKAY